MYYYFRLVVVVLSMSAWLCELCGFYHRSSHVHVVLRITDNCGTKYGHNADCPQYCGQMRTNAENCGQIADKCEHAGIKLFDMER